MKLRENLVRVDILLVIAACVGLSSLSFIGYRGYDDFHYVYAALNLLDSGEIVATDHWSIRFPHVLAIYLSLKAFGMSEWALVAPSVLAYIATSLITYLGVRQFWGRQPALVAALLFASTPLFAVLANVPFAMLTQLLLIVLSVWSLVWANETGKIWLNALAGVAIGLAVLTHLTSAAAVLSTTFICLLIYRNWRGWLLCVLGAAAIAVVDIGYFTASQGEPLYRMKVASNHSSITYKVFNVDDKSAASVKSVANSLEGTSSKSLFKFMTKSEVHWEPAPVNIHWTVNPYLVFFLHYDLAVYGLALLIAFLLSRTVRLKPLSPAQSRIVLALIITAVVWFLFANYIFSLRPKTRYFGIISYSISTLLAIYYLRFWQLGKSWVKAFVLTLSLGGLGANLLLIDMRESNLTEHRHLAQYLESEPSVKVVVPETFTNRLYPRVLGISEQRLLTSAQVSSDSLWLVAERYGQDLPFQHSCEVWQSHSRTTVIGHIIQWIGVDSQLPVHIKNKLVQPEKTIRLVHSCENSTEAIQ